MQYTIKATFWDKQVTCIAENEITNTVKPNDFVAYSGMSKLSDIHPMYSIDDIYYYGITVDAVEIEDVEETKYEESTSNKSLMSSNNSTVSSSIEPDNSIEDDASILSKVPSQIQEYKSYDYVIDKYDIDIIVNENNTLDITETITAYFNTEKHGIYRTIPLTNTVTRTDGTISKNNVIISNVSVNDEYSTSIEYGDYKIQIGSESKTLIGTQTYVIKYNYNIGKDPLKDCDELYFNIIGTEWTTVIGDVNFNITMPKSFDSSKIGFSSGKVGSTKNNIQYSISGNTITGNNTSILNPKEGITIRLELEEGYFTGSNISFSGDSKYLLIIPFASLCIALLLWAKFGKDDEVIETVEFYPPEGFNSLELGFLYKGEATNKDATSLLIYLANKGYIEIVEYEEESLFSKTKSFKIKKLKDYDGTDANERIFLDGLFKRRRRRYNRNVIDQDTEEVTASELYDEFYVTMSKILKNINNHKNKNKIFETYTASKTSCIIIMIIISLLTILGIPTVAYTNSWLMVVPTIALAAFYSVFFGVGFFTKGMSIVMRIFWIGFTTFHASMFFAVMPITYALRSNTTYLVGFIFGIMCIIGMILCVKAMPKRTKYGNEILGKIRGFKTFLETAKKEELESMVLKNPKYFYDILPYTYVLGVSDVWINKFEYISMEEPDWYINNTGHFDVHTFGSFMNNTMSSAERAMSYSASSSSSGGGGGSSGGGSSGGGSGGGGGGSW